MKIYDHNCPVCQGLKLVKIRQYPNPGNLEEWSEFDVAFGYKPPENERILFIYCSECGIKFVNPY